jgi:hypothetical protein
MSDSPYPLCDHLKDNGERCGSPAKKGEKLCHFHGRAADTTKLPGKPGYRLATIECAESIQITVMHVTQALLDGAIDAKTANVIFRGLSLVKSILPDLPNRQRPALAPALSASAGTAVTNVTNGATREPLLAAHELAGIRKIIRQGPKHRDFARASRILDTYIASRPSA